MDMFDGFQNLKGGSGSAREISGEPVEKKSEGPARPAKKNQVQEPKGDGYVSIFQRGGSGSASQKLILCASLAATRTSTHAIFLLSCN